MYDDFKELLPKNKLSEVFTFITTNREKIDYKNLEQTVGLENIRNFLSGYLKTNYRSYDNS
jgi:hypothetical protein